MAKKKLKWNDVEDIAFRLIDEHPSMNPMRLNANDLKNYVGKLPDFADDLKKAKPETLENIQKVWFEERSDMEDELGPFEDTPIEGDEELDEDEYRDDKMIDEKILGDDDDEDEDELGDGFQEEGEEED